MGRISNHKSSQRQRDIRGSQSLFAIVHAAGLLPVTNMNIHFVFMPVDNGYDTCCFVILHPSGDWIL